ncbi:hypothetical protein [Streptomyces sp. NBC_01615]|uniref:hypothetical protein n=1 Tax=Streptomyces sp. NBC_01615 TaxID=2975898 RepID=UPI003863639F
MHRNVHRRHHLAAPVPHRGGDRAQPLLQFLVDDGVPLTPYAPEFGPKVARPVRGRSSARASRASISSSGRWKTAGRRAGQVAGARPH